MINKCKLCETCKTFTREYKGINLQEYCNDSCKNLDVFDGDKLIKELNKDHTLSSCDCIIEKNGVYIFIEFKDIVKAIDNNNECPKRIDIEKKYKETEKLFNVINSEIILVFNNILLYTKDYENKIFTYNKLIQNKIVANDSFILDNRSINIKYKLCKNDDENLSFEKYLEKISV